MNFTVYKSSAGSGKTYTLVKEYLKIALVNSKPDNYRGILAITFTNKATSEMKARIISALKALSSNEMAGGTNYHLKKDLIKELNIDEDILKSRSKNTLSHILHHYSDFSISTIDKFVYKIVKAFARDLRIPMNFEVELDSANLLRKAIDQLIARAGSESLLTKILVEFTEQKAEDEKSWNIENDLFVFAKELLKEESMNFTEGLRNTNTAQLLKAKEDLLIQIRTFESEIKKIGKEALREIETSGISISSFSGGKNGICKYFSYLAECRTDKLNPSVTVQKNVMEGKWHSASAGESERNKIINIKNTLHELFLNAVNYLENNSKNYYLFRLIFRNIYSLAVLHELELITEEIKTEKNIVHISEFNKKISQIVTKESAPFIYERLGEKFKNFLVDEFQDTSSLQWLNLLPLIHNSLSEGNFNMIVGDGKQAIYRWRSGDVQQFSNLPSIAEAKKNKEVNSIISEREQSLKSNFSLKFLDKNFRSKKEIVVFNNYFFEELSLKLETDFRKIYLGQEQEFLNENTGGYVHIEMLREELFDDLPQKYLERTIEIINECKKDNFKLNDLCILCRKNSDASRIASFLLENNVPVISSESLLLNNNIEVKFLISFLSFINNPAEKSFQCEILLYLHEKKFLQGDLHFTLRKVAVTNDHSYFISKIKESGFDFDLDRFRKFSLYELVENLLRLFFTGNIPGPYISFFMETIQTFLSSETNNISDFLESWEQKKQELSIVTPEGVNAVRIMTIHKAKGLEFPVIIFPFANWQENLTTDYFWIDLRKNEKSIPGQIFVPDGLHTAIVEVSKEMEQTDLNSRYQEEKGKTQLDNFNLLYVAFTRAKDRLFVLSSIEKQKNLSKSFIEILQKHPAWNEDSHILVYGKKYLFSPLPDEPNPIESFTTPMISTDWHQKIFIKNSDREYLDSGKQKNYGILMHLVLSQLNSLDDFTKAMDILTVGSDCNSEEKKGIENKIKNLLANPLVKPFFMPGLSVKTEAEIILSDGEICRPDRVIFYDDHVKIIDYKTGIPLEKHKTQIEKYAQALKEMGYNKIQKFLIYSENETVLQIQ